MEKITRKGIVLAGGANSRLYPITRSIPKSLLPIYDKPLIYYSLAVLMLADIRDILVITTPHGLAAHRDLLGNGDSFGVNLSYLVQEKPHGISDAYIIGKPFIDGHPSALILSDNIFYGGNLVRQLQNAAATTSGATVFAYRVPDPERFAVICFDDSGKTQSLEEKPNKPQSNFAVPGCYFYDERACEFAAALQPSKRGELEITDLNHLYLNAGDLTVERLGRGLAWFDTGTPDSLAEAADFVRVIQKQQGLMIACLEEIAWRQGWISDKTLNDQADQLKNTPYGDYLCSLTGN